MKTIGFNKGPLSKSWLKQLAIVHAQKDAQIYDQYSALTQDCWREVV